MRQRDHDGVFPIARRLRELGVTLMATEGNCAAISQAGIECEMVRKVQQGRPNILDRIINDDVDLIVNTTEGRQAIEASRYIRQQALARRVTYSTTLAGAMATCHAIASDPSSDVYSLRELHEEIA